MSQSKSDDNWVKDALDQYEMNKFGITKKDINKRDDYFKLVADTHKEFIELEKNDKSFNMSLEEYFEKKGVEFPF